MDINSLFDKILKILLFGKILHPIFIVKLSPREMDLNWLFTKINYVKSIEVAIHKIKSTQKFIHLQYYAFTNLQFTFNISDMRVCII